MGIDQQKLYSSANQSLLSVGIDVGTTSTHLTISHLQLGNSSRLHQVPRLTISKKEIIYRSKIFFTPLTEDGLIDAQGVQEIVSNEYAKAGIKPTDVQTGAVIITGETARLRNAQAVTRALSELAGQFVVESAGANLESILAGKGSGAAKASLENPQAIANVDIGGGTTNIAVFVNGASQSTDCINIGGRFISFTPDGRIKHITDSGKRFLQAIKSDLTVGSSPTDDVLHNLADHLGTELVSKITESKKGSDERQIDQFWFSGGVAALMVSFMDETHEQAHANTINYREFGDMGVFLAESLCRNLKARGANFKIVPDPIRATVIGAGLHSLQLTGSTIGITGQTEQLRNLPIVRVTCKSNDGLHDNLKECLHQHDLNWAETSVAIALNIDEEISFVKLQAWAESIANAFSLQSATPPLVLLTERDVAMALSQLLKGLLPDTPAIILDGVDTAEGDFVDIGLPLSKSSSSPTQTVPVIIKSLIFRESQD